MDATAEAAARNEYLRRKYGRLRAHMMWRPSDIVLDTAHEWWEDVLHDNHDDVRPETRDTSDTSACAETTRRCTACESCESTPTPGTPEVF